MSRLFILSRTNISVKRVTAGANRGALRGVLLVLVLMLFSVAPVVLAQVDSAGGFPVVGDDFPNYIENVGVHIKKRQMAARSEADSQFNLPFELAANPDAAYQGRFLLIHGLNDSPYVWNDMGHSIAQMGFDVRAILLPGHGTTPKEMLDVHYTDWLDAVRDHIALWQSQTQSRLSEQVNEQEQGGDAGKTSSPLYLGGFSLGGVLATAMALENPSVRGLLLVSPAWHSKLNHLLRWSGIYKRFQPWLFGGMIMEDNPAKYNSIPINSAAQYYYTSRYLKRRWKKRKLDIPVLIVATTDDSVVDVEYMLERYRKRFTSPKRAMVIYSNDTSMMLKETEVRRSSALIERRIINQSHLSLVNNPDNELFGSEGRILVCNGNEPEIFFGCLRARGHWFGAQNTPSPDGVAVARTTYNPDFEYLVEMVEQIFPSGPDTVATE